MMMDEVIGTAPCVAARPKADPLNTRTTSASLLNRKRRRKERNRNDRRPPPPRPPSTAPPKASFPLMDHHQSHVCLLAARDGAEKCRKKRRRRRRRGRVASSDCGSLLANRTATAEQSSNQEIVYFEEKRKHCSSSIAQNRNNLFRITDRHPARARCSPPSLMLSRCLLLATLITAIDFSCLVLVDGQAVHVLLPSKQIDHHVQLNPTTSGRRPSDQATSSLQIHVSETTPTAEKMENPYSFGDNKFAPDNRVATVAFQSNAEAKAQRVKTNQTSSAPSSSSSAARRGERADVNEPCDWSLEQQQQRRRREVEGKTNLSRTTHSVGSNYASGQAAVVVVSNVTRQHKLGGVDGGPTNEQFVKRDANQTEMRVDSEQEAEADRVEETRSGASDDEKNNEEPDDDDYNDYGTYIIYEPNGIGAENSEDSSEKQGEASPAAVALATETKVNSTDQFVQRVFFAARRPSRRPPKNNNRNGNTDSERRQPVGGGQSNDEQSEPKSLVNHQVNNASWETGDDSDTDSELLVDRTRAEDDDDDERGDEVTRGESGPDRPAREEFSSAGRGGGAQVTWPTGGAAETGPKVDGGGGGDNKKRRQPKTNNARAQSLSRARDKLGHTGPVSLSASYQSADDELTSSKTTGARSAATMSNDADQSALAADQQQRPRQSDDDESRARRRRHSKFLSPFPSPSSSSSSAPPSSDSLADSATEAPEVADNNSQRGEQRRPRRPLASTRAHSSTWPPDALSSSAASSLNPLLPVNLSSKDDDDTAQRRARHFAGQTENDKRTRTAANEGADGDEDDRDDDDNPLQAGKNSNAEPAAGGGTARAVPGRRAAAVGGGAVPAALALQSPASSLEPLDEEDVRWLNNMNAKSKSIPNSEDVDYRQQLQQQQQRKDTSERRIQSSGQQPESLLQQDESAANNEQQRQDDLLATATSSNESTSTSSSSSSLFANSTTTTTTTDPGDSNVAQHKVYYWRLVWFVLPLGATFGNLLVIMAVHRERSLQSVTNYFIVSLAFADLFVGLVVMPFAVYVLVNEIWELSDAICDIFVAVDVTSSTASILNLVAISIDRYLAIAHPIAYSAGSSSTRAKLTIFMVWLISCCVGAPIILGLNTSAERKSTHCMLYNSTFIFWSSLTSFYVPCIVMIGLYWRIFSAIRSRTKKAIQAGNHHHHHTTTATTSARGQSIKRKQQQQQQPLAICDNKTASAVAGQGGPTNKGAENSIAEHSKQQQAAQSNKACRVHLAPDGGDDGDGRREKTTDNQVSSQLIDTAHLSLACVGPKLIDQRQIVGSSSTLDQTWSSPGYNGNGDGAEHDDECDESDTVRSRSVKCANLTRLLEKEKELVRSGSVVLTNRTSNFHSDFRHEEASRNNNNNKLGADLDLEVGRVSGGLEPKSGQNAIGGGKLLSRDSSLKIFGGAKVDRQQQREEAEDSQQTISSNSSQSATSATSPSATSTTHTSDSSNFDCSMSIAGDGYDDRNHVAGHQVASNNNNGAGDVHHHHPSGPRYAPDANHQRQQVDCCQASHEKSAPVTCSVCCEQQNSGNNKHDNNNTGCLVMFRIQDDEDHAGVCVNGEQFANLTAPPECWIRKRSSLMSADFRSGDTNSYLTSDGRRFSGLSRDCLSGTTSKCEITTACDCDLSLVCDATTTTTCNSAANQRHQSRCDTQSSCSKAQVCDNPMKPNGREQQGEAPVPSNAADELDAQRLFTDHDSGRTEPESQGQQQQHSACVIQSAKPKRRSMKLTNLIMGKGNNKRAPDGVFKISGSTVDDSTATATAAASIDQQEQPTVQPGGGNSNQSDSDQVSSSWAQPTIGNLQKLNSVDQPQQQQQRAKEAQSSRNDNNNAEQMNHNNNSSTVGPATNTTSLLLQTCGHTNDNSNKEMVAVTSSADTGHAPKPARCLLSTILENILHVTSSSGPAVSPSKGRPSPAMQQKLETSGDNSHRRNNFDLNPTKVNNNNNNKSSVATTEAAKTNTNSAGAMQLVARNQQQQQQQLKPQLQAHRAGSRRRREKNAAKRERKATKTLAIVLGIFLICWTPFFTCNIIDGICIQLNMDCRPGMMVYLVVSWLGYINSCVNPIIYTIFNIEFRRAFKKILTTRPKCCAIDSSGK